MSTTIYNHRPLPPTAPAQPARGPGSDQLLIRDTYRTPDALDIIRQDFEGITQELTTLRVQRDEYEQQVSNQIHEIDSFRRALHDLDERNKHQRSEFEKEAARLRAELQDLQARVPPSNAPLPPSSQQNPQGHHPPPPNNYPPDGFYPLNNNPRREIPNDDRDIVMRDREREKDLLRDRERLDRQRERDDTSRELRRKDKALKAEPDQHPFPPLSQPNAAPNPAPSSNSITLAPSTPSALPGGPNKSIQGGPPPPSSNGPSSQPSGGPGHAGSPAPPPSQNGNSSARAHSQHPEPQTPSQSGVPGLNTNGTSSNGVPPNPPAFNHSARSGSGDVALAPTTVTIAPAGVPLADLEPDQVPSELKKEGSDWWAIFAANVPKVLDVSLSLTLTHESVVCCVRFSADGKYLATGCNRTAQIFDTKTGARTCVLADDAATKTGDLYIRSVCFSPDGKYLATGAEDRQIRIWDIAKRKIRNIFEGHKQEIYSLDFSSDGKLIVSGSGDKTARIWDMESGHSTVLSIIEPEHIDAGVTSVAISPDNRFVAAGSLDMLVRIWDVQTGLLVERLKGHKDSVYSVAFSPDGKGLVSGSLDKTLKYWDISPLIKAVAAGTVLGGLPQSTTIPSNTVPPPGYKEPGKKDGAGEKGSVCTVAFTGHKDYVLSVAVSPDGAWVVSGSKDRGVQFWNPKDAQTQLMLQGHKNSVISIALSPAGGLLATGSGDWQARVWSYTTLPNAAQ